METLYILYKTTNLVNDKTYIGIHKTNNLDDGYLGSGFSLIKAVSKYGKENFKREILEFCNSYDELLELEKLYVDLDWVRDKSTYNRKGVDPWNKGLKGVQVGWNQGLKLGPMTEEEKEKRSKTLKERWKNQEHHSKGVEPWNKGLKGSQIAWNKGVEMEKIECPHCGKMCDKGNAKRWHFDNCKEIKDKKDILLQD